MTDQFSTHEDNSDDGSLDERDLYAPDGGDDPDEDYPFMTEYQVQRLRDFISEDEMAYDEEALGSKEAFEASGMEATEKKIFDYVGLLMKDRDARLDIQAARIAELEATIAELEARRVIYGQVEKAAQALEQSAYKLGYPMEVNHLLTALKEAGLIEGKLE